MKRHPLALIAVLSAALAHHALPAAAVGDWTPDAPKIPGKTFPLADYGAVGDGATLNTVAFKAAIAAVDKAGGGTLEIPDGVFLTGPLVLCNAINVHLAAHAVVRFSSKAGDYASEGRRLRPQITVMNRHDVEISGSGTLDGQGGAWWPAARAMRDPVTGQQYNGTTPRPAMLVFSRCDRVRVEGVTMINAAALNLGITAGSDAAIVGVTINNPPDSPNTDGIDPKGARRVLITRCHIDTGDDCIAAGGSGGSVEEDILITDCAFFHGHGCSIGSGTAGGVRNFTVRNCTFDGTDSGIRLKSGRDRGGVTENVTYEDLVMKNVGRAISVSSQYKGTTVDSASMTGEPVQPVIRTTPQWRNLVIRNVTATGCRLDAGFIAGLPEMPVDGVTLDHVSIEAPKGLQIGYAHAVALHDVHIEAKEGVPLYVSDTVSGVTR